MGRKRFNLLLGACIRPLNSPKGLLLGIRAGSSTEMNVVCSVILTAEIKMLCNFELKELCNLAFDSVQTCSRYPWCNTQVQALG